MTAMLRLRNGRFLTVLITLAGAAALLRFGTSEAVQADIRTCHCDTSNRTAMEQDHQCSLCLEAEKQPPYVDVFFLKDRNPTKPNRMLALPRTHTEAGHSLSSLSPETRHLLWATAITKAQELWGNDWGIAYNGDEKRTQCHTHLHLGKLLPDQEGGRFAVVAGPADIPAPTDGTGIWVHPVAGKLHVHLGEQVNEFVLMR
jgi:diadenosine tetraphosphate (Ap4A) HIT family hydrolase